MKKVLSLLLVAALVLPLGTVFAAQPSDYNDTKNVTVGVVDSTTVYSVDIAWGDLSYDWKLVSGTNEFVFEPELNVMGNVASSQTVIDQLEQYVTDGLAVYDDYTLTTPHVGEFQLNNTYYTKTSPAPTISVEDRSVNGRIKARATFAPSSAYSSWVTGNFYKNTSYASNKLVYKNELTNGYLNLAKIGPSYYGEAYLQLAVNNALASGKTVEAGATIGTITLEISQNTD